MTWITSIGKILASLAVKIMDRLVYVSLGKERQKRRDAEANVEILKQDQEIDNMGDVDRAALIDRLRGKGK